MKMSLRTLLRPTVHDQPARAALHGAAVWTYQRLEEDAQRLARRWLAGGLEPGDRVALLLPNRPEALLVYLACFKAGLVAVALDYRYRPSQINYVLRHSGSRVLVTHADRLEEVAACDEAKHIDVVAVGGERPGTLLPDEAPAPGGDEPVGEFRPDDVAVLFYTSGTTGRPKGVMLTRAALMAGTTKFLARVAAGAGRRRPGRGARDAAIRPADAGAADAVRRRGPRLAGAVHAGELPGGPPPAPGQDIPGADPKRLASGRPRGWRRAGARTSRVCGCASAAAIACPGNCTVPSMP